MSAAAIASTRAKIADLDDKIDLCIRLQDEAWHLASACGDTIATLYEAKTELRRLLRRLGYRVPWPDELVGRLRKPDKPSKAAKGKAGVKKLKGYPSRTEVRA